MNLPFSFNITLNTMFHLNKKHFFITHMIIQKKKTENNFYLVVWLQTWSGIFGHLAPESACVTSSFEISILERC